MTLRDKIRSAVVSGIALSTMAACATKQPQPEPDLDPDTEDAAAEKTPVELQRGDTLGEAASPSPAERCRVQLEQTKHSPNRYRYCAPAENNSNCPAPSQKIAGAFVCGPVSVGTQCCWVYERNVDREAEFCLEGDCQERKHYRGRPFFVGDEARTSDVVATDRWAEVVDLDLSSLTPAERERLADAWARAGAEEHASIASFSRFLLDLMSLGAPSELILGTTRAINDEVRHARQCFGIASAFAGRPLGPGPLPVGEVARQERSAAQVLRDAIVEGCIGETIAAAGAGWLVGHARDKPIRETLETIARDEGYHAALAWRFVAWLLVERPELEGVARRAFGLTGPVVEASGVPTVGSSVDARYGVVPSEVEGALSEHVFATVIRPEAERLLSGE